ncbi:MAG: transporter substrate-binding domain-containing protein, partial [Undibacterium sp.]|nr:transporter substrate-binding domain-containing protein [Undibacterium sp.]
MKKRKFLSMMLQQDLCSDRHRRIPDVFYVVLMAIIGLGLTLAPDNSRAQTPVPLLFGENKNNKGEQLPMPPAISQFLGYFEKQLAIKFEIKNYPWNRAVLMANYDGDLIFGISATSEREKTLHFSEPVFYNYIWLVTRSDGTFPFSTLQDLKGKKIGIIRGSYYGDEFDSKKNKLFTVEDDVNAYAPRLKKLLTKRMDAMLYPSTETNVKNVEQQVNRILQSEMTDSGSAKENNFRVLPVPLLKDGIRFA